MPPFSRSAYEDMLYRLPEHYSEVLSSTVRLYTNSPTTAFVRGHVHFCNGVELRVFEYLDLSDGQLLDYSYTVYAHGEKIRWYDPQPHPENPDLAATFPHHRHEPPDIKHNRQPAPGLSFDAPNLPTLIAECVALGETVGDVGRGG